MKRLVALSALLVTTACAGGAGSENGTSGTIAVEVSSLYAGTITRMSVSVSPAGVTSDLVFDPTDGKYKGSVVVPSGDQTITVEAFDPANTVVGRGSATVLVAPNTTSKAVIRVVDVTGPPPVPDHSPLILGVTASNAQPESGETVTLMANATDPDQDPMTFAWSQTCQGGVTGTLTSDATATATWTAPGAATGCVIRVDVSANGKSTGATIELTVTLGQGSVAVEAVFIPHPSITMFTVWSPLFWTAFRDSSDATFPQAIAPGSVVDMQPEVDENSDWSAMQMTSDCGGVLTRDDFLSRWNWTAPSQPSFCVITATISRDGLTDSFPVAFAVR